MEFTYLFTILPLITGGPLINLWVNTFPVGISPKDYAFERMKIKPWITKSLFSTFCKKHGGLDFKNLVSKFFESESTLSFCPP